MPKFTTARLKRATIGVAVMSAFAVAPVAAQAQDTGSADTPLNGTLSAGSLTFDAPVITPFTAPTSGVLQTVETDVAGWPLADLRGTNAGYVVQVTASDSTVNGNPDAGSLLALNLAPVEPDPVGANANTAPTPSAPVDLDPTEEQTILSAAIGEGQGTWTVPAAADSLDVTIPATALAGAYASTLTYTTAPPAV